jgi:hypothetical protein
MIGLDPRRYPAMGVKGGSLVEISRRHKAPLKPRALIDRDVPFS